MEIRILPNTILSKQLLQLFSRPMAWFGFFIVIGMSAGAQVTTLQNWTNLYNNTSTAQQNFTYAVSAGSNSSRVLVVAIASSQTLVGSRTVAITYGGRNLTPVSGDMGTATTRQHTGFYYLNESDLDLAANTTLSVTVSGGTTRLTTIWSAVFDYVDQTTPVTSTPSYNSITTTLGSAALVTALSVTPNDQAVSVVSSLRSGNTARTHTYSANWSMVNEQTTNNTDGVRNGVANRSIPVATANDNATVTFSGNALASLTGMVIKGCARPSANAGSALSAICRGGTSAALGGSVGGSATGGTWSDGGVGGTFTPNATTLNATYTPPAAYTGTVTLTLTSTGGTCGVATANKTLTVTNPPSASVAYSSAIYCNSILTAQIPTITGSAGGTFTSTPGLALNSSTGAINPSSSTPGNYTVSYSISAAGGCNSFVSNTPIQILNDQNTITYPQLSYCNNFSGSVAVTRNSPVGGTYSATPAGLSIDATSGSINVSASMPGTYTIIYTFSGGSCSNTVSTSITIKSMPAVSCPANTGTCQNSPSFTLTGGTPFGGTYTGTGVSGNAFNPSVAGLGTFPITYSYTSNGCTSTCSFNVSVNNSSLNATATPVSNFVYSGNPAIINLASTVPGTQYTWTVTSNSPTVTGYSNQTVPTTGPINQVINNPNTTVAQLTYVITPQLIGCTGTPITVVISLPSTTYCESPGTFQAGSCIIDMGVTPQTYNNGLKPYGLVYQLLNTNRIPVYWCINPNKTFEQQQPKVDQADFTVDGRTFRGGPFVIPAAYRAQVQSVINSWVAQGVVVHYSTTSFNPPMYELLTRIPKVVLDAATGVLVETGFYQRAGIPITAYTKGGIPSAITNCDDIYVLPHATPQNWTQAQKDSLRNFINNRGWFFSSCYAVSFIENMPNMNFLSNNGLLAYNAHTDPTVPYHYSLGSGVDAATAAADPFMQHVGVVDGAIDNDASFEKIYVPNAAGWRSSTKIAIFKQNYTNNGINYNNNAAIMAYGRAYGDNNKGLVMYLSGHDFESGANEAQNVAKARIFASFLLRSGAGTRPRITPVSIPSSCNSGETINIEVSIPPSTSTIVTTEWTSDLNGIFSSQGTSTTFTAPTVDVPTICTIQFKVTDACGRTGLYCTTILINPTISNNNIGNAQTICTGNTPSVLNGSTPFYAAGNNFTYLWVMSTTSASTGFSPAPGVNNQQNYAPGALSQTTWFRREVTAYGITVSSASIEISVSTGPAISLQPSTASQSVCGGGAFNSISVAAAVTGVTYQWYSNTAATNNGGVLISGATASSYTPPANTVTGFDLYYYCVITNAQGCRTISNVSGSFTVTQPPIITTNLTPLDTTLCQGQPMNPLSVTVSSQPASYRWFYNTVSSNTGGIQIATIPATSNVGTYTPAMVGTYYYYCWVLPPSGCGSVIRSQVVGPITINQSPSLNLTNNTGSSTITCNVPSISVTANSDAGVTYTWSNGLGSTPNMIFTDSGSYSITVTGSNGCTKTDSINVGWGIYGSTWTGANDAEWDNDDNWCGGVPTDTSDVVIPSGTPNEPVISSSHLEAHARNLTIASNTVIYLDDQRIELHGNLSGAGLINAINGKVELKGTVSSQTIRGSQFVANTIQKLKISNSNGVVLQGNYDTLRVTDVVEFGKSNCTLFVNNNLTLVSNINATARVADFTNGGQYAGNRIQGNVTVERYVPNHSKAWQLLAAPTNGQSIKDAWQEGNTPISNSNNPGYGTIITSNLGGSAAGAQILGFDIYTPAGATMKTYSPATDTWVSVPNTTGPIANSQGYMLFVRGDRSVTAFNQAATATTLRTSGVLYQPEFNTPAITNVSANKFQSVANPYASAIDVSKINRTGGVQDVYYVWDPKLTNSSVSVWGLGAWQTIVKVGNIYTVVPGGGSYANGNVNIESGQAFLVRAVDADGSISFNESCKTSGSNMVTRSIENYTFLSAKLMGKTTTDSVLLDGALCLFDPMFNQEIDLNDARKILTGNAESISILNQQKKLVAEQRGGLSVNDTLMYSISGMRRQTYMLKLNFHEFLQSGLNAYLIDNYLQTKHLLNKSEDNHYSFSITADSGSYQVNRFMVVFKKDETPQQQVAFTSFRAFSSSGTTNVLKWTINLNEKVSAYDLERSEDGINFVKIKTLAAQRNTANLFSYVETDEQAIANQYVYRVKANLKNLAGVVYSSSKKISKSIPTKGEMYVYPNPVENKNIIVYFSGFDPGEYWLKLSDVTGKIISMKKIMIYSNSASVAWPQSSINSAGNYTLSVFSNEEKKWSLQLFLK